MKSSKKPRISVCIPVHNAELWLAESIKSIIDQTFTDWEIICIDDYSTDSSRIIIDHYLKVFKEKGIWERFKYHRNEDLNNHKKEGKKLVGDFSEKLEKLHTGNIGGIADTRNHAAAYAEGEIICVQDADDISHKERLEKVWAYFKRHKKIDLVFGSCQYIDALGKPFHQVNAEPFLIERLCKENWIQHPTVAYRKKAFEEVGGYRSDCKVLDDWFLYYDFWKHGKVLDGMNDVLAFYRVLPTSVSRSEEKAAEIKMMKEKFLKEANENTGSLAR